MATFINEQKMIDDSIFKFEQRLNTQVSRFLDKNPVFVTYFHINVNETTTDDGFRDIESIIGKRSPLRFQKIENFPMYGLEAVVLNIQDSEQGLDTEFQDDCVILPNTIKPLPNDFFMIKHVKESFIFRVIEVSYDSIRPDNFYKITYRLEWLDDGKVEEINNQVEEKFTCILENIGSENNCILKDEYKVKLDEIDDMFNDMVNTYKTIFYNERYNCFLGDDGHGYKLYDPLQTIFLNNHKIFNKRNRYDTLILTEGFNDNKRQIKYEKSIYRFFERRDVKLVNTFQYNKIPGVHKKDSAFSRWNDKAVYIVDIPLGSIEGSEVLLPSDIAMGFKMNNPTDSVYIDFMQRFVRNEKMTIYDIPLTLNEELLRLDANAEVFFYTPILLYIIQTIVNDFLKEKE